MIGFVLGTGEGREILSFINKTINTKSRINEGGPFPLGCSKAKYNDSQMT